MKFVAKIRKKENSKIRETRKVKTREANTKNGGRDKRQSWGRNKLNGGKVRKTERRPEMHWQIIGTPYGTLPCPKCCCCAITAYL